MKKDVALQFGFVLILGILIGYFLNEGGNVSTEDFNYEEDTARQESRSQEGDSHKVKQIIDGDTFILSDGRKVRMLGIDTPERGDLYYDEATEELKRLLQGGKVKLTRDVSSTDKYGRLLRHAYVGDQWINAQMISGGFARMVTFQPDNMHVSEFQQLEREARENNRGIWGLE